MECPVEGCGKPRFCRQWCSAHYNRWQRHGNPLSGGTSPGKPAAFVAKAIDYQGDDCLTWPFGKLSNGYATVHDKNGKTKLVSRVICEAVNGPPPTKRHQAAHSCGNGHKACVNPYHLRWATPLENVAESNIAKGSRSGRNTLNEEQVMEISRLYGNGHGPTQDALARRFGITRTAIKCIVHGQSWAWLTCRTRPQKSFRRGSRS